MYEGGNNSGANNGGANNNAHQSSVAVTNPYQRSDYGSGVSQNYGHNYGHSAVVQSNYASPYGLNGPIAGANGTQVNPDQVNVVVVTPSPSAPSYAAVAVPSYNVGPPVYVQPSSTYAAASAAPKPVYSPPTYYYPTLPPRLH
jgi:hypothetical protein